MERNRKNHKRRTGTDTAQAGSAPKGTYELIEKAGLKGPFALLSHPGGANNRLFRVELGHARYFLKSYFWHQEDRRDRLGAEFAFSEFMWNNGIRAIPKPLACDPENRLALYEFIDGRSLLPSEITEEILDEALTFFCQINASRASPGARELPIASEACFSLSQHLECIDTRVHNLGTIRESSDIHREAIRFVHSVLFPKWRSLKNSVSSHASKLGLEMESEIDPQDHCLSPSDFGFHNAIMAPSGKLKFIDFEYAGWDDPAKTVCDFFCQPAIPVPLCHYRNFAKAVAQELSLPELRLRLMNLLFPVYRIKWSCIVLNDFMEIGGKRRHFAQSKIDLERQLQKAKNLLRQVD